MSPGFDNEHRGKKSVKINENELGPTSTKSSGAPLKSSLAHKVAKRSLSATSSRGRKVTGPVSPRRATFEAKFEKFVTNKIQKVQQDKKVKDLKMEDFDFVTKNPGSPSRRHMNYIAYKAKMASSKAGPGADLIPHGYEEHLVRSELLNPKGKGDPFKLLGVSNEDKMAFFLLKWVYNAIALENDNGDSYVTNKSLLS